MQLSEKEVMMVNQSLAIPLMAFGADRFQSKIGIDNLPEVNRILEVVRISSKIEPDDIGLLLKAFIVARDIADETEYQTLTGFSWNESLDFILGLINELGDENKSQIIYTDNIKIK